MSYIIKICSFSKILVANSNNTSNCTRIKWQLLFYLSVSSSNKFFQIIRIFIDMFLSGVLIFIKAHSANSDLISTVTQCNFVIFYSWIVNNMYNAAHLFSYFWWLMLTLICRTMETHVCAYSLQHDWDITFRHKYGW